MAFDWQHFLDSRGIPYVTKGKNVARNSVAVRCPFCGNEDPSQHMNINLAGKGWGCFRNDEHRGKSIARLVQALLGCSWELAHSIAGTTTSLPDDFYGTVMGLVTPKPQEQGKPRVLELPKEFRRFDEPRPSAKPFLRYLEDERGFFPDEIATLTKRYGVYYATSGWFRYRVLFTVRENGALVSWTGRSISTTTLERYKTLPVDSEETKDSGLPTAIGPLPDYLLWFDRLMKADADTICLCEGPFDALKVSVLGRSLGIVATCFFTAAPTARQVSLLHEVLPRYKHRFLLLDRGTLAKSLRIAGDLSVLNVIPTEMPAGVKDPGDFHSKAQVRALLLDQRKSRA